MDYEQLVQIQKGARFNRHYKKRIADRRTHYRSIEVANQLASKLKPETLAIATQELHQIKAVPDIWQSMVHDILSCHHYNLTRLSQALGISTRTLMRIRDGRTVKPHHRTAYRLFHLHRQLRPELYQVN